MSNVLPTEDKKILARRFRARFIFSTALVLLLGAFIAMISLVPTYLAIRAAQSALPSENDISESARDDQLQSARALALVAALTPIVNATSSSPIETAQKALSLKPAGMSISSVRYSKGKIDLTGVATNREAVTIFRDALQAEGSFSSVAVPVAAIVGTQEGRFTITLLGSF